MKRSERYMTDFSCQKNKLSDFCVKHIFDSREKHTPHQ